MTVAASTHVNINKKPNSNNCLLKVSLVDVVQSEPQEVNNDEHVVIKILVNDYTTQEHKDINYVSTHLSAKKQLSKPGNLQLAVASPKLIHSKLLATHRNIIEESEKVSDGSTLTKPIDSDEIDLNQSDVFTSNPRSSKHLKTKKVNELARDLLGIDDLELAKFSFTGDELQSDDEVNINKILAKNNEYEKGNDFSSAKEIHNYRMGSKNRRCSTCKVRKQHSTTSTKSEVHVVSDNNHDEE
ncbi:9850_t:CDS:2 [Cetraspora pellucida]|uniref:9850_t:CDS:1 n=1 Tax=Cetraspora pellucida TaxID=1433469 RepID=A0ACA9LGM0_9GLOM|nr:9850_t:CDS:2 [Cetraspora pellucida]